MITETLLAIMPSGQVTLATQKLILTTKALFFARERLTVRNNVKVTLRLEAAMNSAYVSFSSSVLGNMRALVRYSLISDQSAGF